MLSKTEALYAIAQTLVITCAIFTIPAVIVYFSVA